MILSNLLYIYQLEEYDVIRFFRFVYSRIKWNKLQQRNKMEWTLRSTLIYIISIALLISMVVLVLITSGIFYSLLVLLVCIILLPLLIVISDLLIWPLVTIQKNRIVRKGNNLVRETKKKGLITIGITGSFGKTTTKNIANTILKEKYTTLTIPGNINTKIGISKFLIQNRKKLNQSNILIVEMGAYRVGEIKELCDLIMPDYSITTAIGENHLERFGSFSNIIKAKFELANNTIKKAFLNNTDININKYYKEQIKDNINIIITDNNDVSDIIALDDYSGISFVYHKQHFKTEIVAKYIIELAIPVFKLADELGINITSISKSFMNIRPVEHRLEIIRNNILDRVIIDDSYNGNFAGFMAGLDVLDRAKGRKVALTPGIVELDDKKSKEVHIKLAKEYSERVDLVLLINNKNTSIIKDIFKELNYINFRVYNSSTEAHKDLANILEKGDTIIFQNDISDNY